MGEVEITRIVIDTNVVVSALLFGGVPGKLVPLWKTGRIRVFTSREMIEEYLRVLAYTVEQYKSKPHRQIVSHLKLHSF